MDTGGQKALFLAVAQNYSQDPLTYFVSNRPDDWVAGEKETLIWTKPSTTVVSPFSVDILTLNNNHKKARPIRQSGGADLIVPDVRITQAITRNGTLWYTHTSQSVGDYDASVWVYKYIRAQNYLEVITRESIAVDFSIAGIAVTNVNTCIVGFNRSSASERISIRAAEYNQGSFEIRPGLAAYAGTRWGDYANDTVDANGIDFWIAHHYPLANGTTGIWIAGTNLAPFRIFTPLVVK